MFDEVKELAEEIALSKEISPDQTILVIMDAWLCPWQALQLRMKGEIGGVYFFIPATVGREKFSAWLRSSGNSEIVQSNKVIYGTKHPLTEISIEAVQAGQSLVKGGKIKKIIFLVPFHKPWLFMGQKEILGIRINCQISFGTYAIKIYLKRFLKLLW